MSAGTTVRIPTSRLRPAVDVAVDDVAPFKAHFTHDTAGYR